NFLLHQMNGRSFGVVKNCADFRGDPVTLLIFNEFGVYKCEWLQYKLFTELPAYAILFLEVLPPRRW
ncbi:hypothetical protein KKG48_03455, partial [Patescibacteria group bacterium]|nr:hypothetical protein [Patescibacteria group bacterium]